MKKIVFGIMLAFLLIGMLTLMFNIQPVKAEGTIYIRADGSIDPPTAPISTVDNVTYVMTGNITSDADGIVVERNNILIDGAGYTIEGPMSNPYCGVNLSGINNVTILDMKIKKYGTGIGLYSSNYNNISGSNITNNNIGIGLVSSSNNNITGNNITANNGHGIWLDTSSDNSISGNTFTNDGLGAVYCYQNSVEGNTVNGRPLVYFEGVSNYTVDDAGQVVLVRCENITVQGLYLSRTDLGVELCETSNSAISGNDITNNLDGIALVSSSNNNITGNNITANIWYGVLLANFSNSNSISRNNITNNSIGIGLYDRSNNNDVSENNIANNEAIGIALESSNNTVVRNNIAMTTTTGFGIGITLLSDDSSNNHIYHNNFIETGVLTYTDAPANSWDNGYPSGGNYWFNYDGIDVKRGPGQDLPGSDGIGDTPRVIKKNNKDRYPLMNPYGEARPSPPPVGGYSFQIEGYTATNPLTPYLTLVAIIAIGFTTIRRKTTKSH